MAGAVRRSHTDLFAEELIDPVSYDPLYEAVALCPCEHNINKSTFDRIYAYAKTQHMHPRCPMCKRVIERYSVDHKIRSLAQEKFPPPSPSASSSDLAEPLLSDAGPAHQPEDGHLAVEYPSTNVKKKKLIKFEDKRMGEINYKHDVEIDRTRVSAQVFVGGSATLNASTIGGDVCVGASVSLNDVVVTGNVSSGSTLSATSSTIHGNIFAKETLSLEDTVVDGDVASLQSVRIKESCIRRKLTCSSNHIVIINSDIDTIILHPIVTPALLDKITTILQGFAFASPYAVEALEAPPSPGTPIVRQIVELNNSHVRKILFKGKNGQVKLLGDSTCQEIQQGPFFSLQP